MKNVAKGADLFKRCAQFIIFESKDDFVTIMIDSRQGESEFSGTIDRINEVIEKAYAERLTKQ